MGLATVKPNCLLIMGQCVFVILSLMLTQEPRLGRNRQAPNLTLTCWKVPWPTRAQRASAFISRAKLSWVLRPRQFQLGHFACERVSTANPQGWGQNLCDFSTGKQKKQQGFGQQIQGFGQNNQGFGQNNQGCGQKKAGGWQNQNTVTGTPGRFGSGCLVLFLAGHESDGDALHCAAVSRDSLVRLLMGWG